MVWRLSFAHGIVKCLWENAVSHDGDGISEWYEVIVFRSGKVVGVCLLIDRNYVSKSAVRLEFLICYFRRGWNFRVVRVSFVPGRREK